MIKPISDPDMRVKSWEEAKQLALQETKRRLAVEIRKYWVDSISLEPRSHGGLWSVRLDLQARKGFRKRLIKVAMKIDPETGEVREFAASAGSARAI